MSEYVVTKLTPARQLRRSMRFVHRLESTNDLRVYTVESARLRATNHNRIDVYASFGPEGEGSRDFLFDADHKIAKVIEGAVVLEIPTQDKEA